MQEYNFFPNKKDIEKINFFLKIFKITGEKKKKENFRILISKRFNLTLVELTKTFFQQCLKLRINLFTE